MSAVRPTPFSPPAGVVPTVPSGRCRISVLMPVYNAAEFVREAVESIQAQTVQDFELVIVEDGSTDSSRKLLEELAAQDSRIRLIRNPENRGIVYSLNRGLEECRGDYIVRMDADDAALPHRLQNQVAVLESDPDILALGSSVTYIDREGNDLGLIRRSETPRTPLLKSFLLHPTVVIRNRALKNGGLKYQERFRYAEDYFLWLQLSQRGKIGVLDQVVMKYRITQSVTRLQHLKGVLWATLKVKWAGVFELGLRPSARDILRFLGECGLLMVPSGLVNWIYRRVTFGKGRPVKL